MFEGSPVFGGKYVVLPADLAAAMFRCYYGAGPRSNESWDEPAQPIDDSSPMTPSRPITNTLSYSPTGPNRSGFKWEPGAPTELDTDDSGDT
jgi:hypothetical protein